MMEHAQWRTNTLDLNYENFKEDLELGVIYGLRRDINMRPIIIVNVRRVIDTKITVERLLAVASFFLEYVIKNAMIPGKIESWTCIFDMKDVGVTKIPKDRIQPLIGTMTKNFRGRLFRMYATDVTFVVRQLMKIDGRLLN